MPGCIQGRVGHLADAPDLDVIQSPDRDMVGSTAALDGRSASPGNYGETVLVIENRVDRIGRADPLAHTAAPAGQLGIRHLLDRQDNIVIRDRGGKIAHADGLSLPHEVWLRWSQKCRQPHRPRSGCMSRHSIGSARENRWDEACSHRQAGPGEARSWPRGGWPFTGMVPGIGRAGCVLRVRGIGSRQL